MRDSSKLPSMHWLVLGIVAVWVGLDQWLKMWTVANIPLNAYNHTTPIPGFLSLAYVQNTGAAWSLFSGSTPVLIAVRILVGTGLLIWLLRNANKIPKWQVVGYAFIVSGAYGNAIDGVRFGYVIDMLQSHWLTAIYKPFFNTSFPIFNLADMGVVGGVLLLLVLSFLPTRKKPALVSSSPEQTPPMPTEQVTEQNDQPSLPTEPSKT
jgi:signal peptidase II